MASDGQKKRCVLITGCSEGGIGIALAREFHRRGLRVLATARDVKKMEALKESGIEMIPLDVVDQESIRGAVDTVSKLTGGTLDLLVNNAGAGYSIPLMDVDLDAARKLFEVNVWGVLAVTQAFVPLLTKASQPRVVNIGSLVAKMPTPWQGVYNASKSALASLSETMRLELAVLGITVLHVYTGGIKTEFLAHSNGQTLPESSIYAPVAGDIQDYVAGSRLRKTQTTTPEAYARNVVGNALSRSPSTTTWVGSMSLISWIGYRFGWDGINDLVFRFMFGMRSLRAKWAAATESKTAASV